MFQSERLTQMVTDQLIVALFRLKKRSPIRTFQNVCFIDIIAYI